MSLFGLERSTTHNADVFDHAINLVDTTAPTDGPDDRDHSPHSERSVKEQTSETLSRKFTKSTLRKQLAQRKYARYRRSDVQDATANEEPGQQETEAAARAESVKPGTLGSSNRLRDCLPFRSKTKGQRHTADEDTFIDVLYENQRGAFFCGIPLYSAKALGNLDPAQWQNSHFQNSAVDIKDAQLPDPSWQWVWRTWYVDMSHDVDEQGWEYSFNFAGRFAWHGSHPWFHSFVRRRRWLRKRARIHTSNTGKRQETGLEQAHKLNDDYFTIHSAKRERDPSEDRTTTFHSSFLGSDRGDSEDEEDFTEVADIPTLLVALRNARVDREKIMAVRSFLKQGGDEIYYLSDNIESILRNLIHQTSRRQLQYSLLEALDRASQNGDASADAKDDVKEKEKQKLLVQNLQKAVKEAGVHINDRDYWGDLKSRTSDVKADSVTETHALDPTEKAAIESTDDAKAHIESKDDAADEIRGISADAEINRAPGIRRPETETETEGDNAQHSPTRNERPLDKGKGRETT